MGWESFTYAFRPAGVSDPRISSLLERTEETLPALVASCPAGRHTDPVAPEVRLWEAETLLELRVTDRGDGDTRRLGEDTEVQ